MVKFLKFVLFVVVMAFSFALGVKFSDSFRVNMPDDQLSVEKEMNDAFSGTSIETQEIIETNDANPVSEEEKQEIENAVVPDYVGMEIVEKQPMDNINEAEINSVPNIDNVDTPENPSAPAPTPELPNSPTNPEDPSMPTAPMEAPTLPESPVIPENQPLPDDVDVVPNNIESFR